MTDTRALATIHNLSVKVKRQESEIKYLRSKNEELTILIILMVIGFIAFACVEYSENTHPDASINGYQSFVDISTTNNTEPTALGGYFI
jgi:hypothetical protein